MSLLLGSYVGLYNFFHHKVEQALGTAGMLRPTCRERVLRVLAGPNSSLRHALSINQSRNCSL